MSHVQQNELEILAPDMELTIAGEPITVHEYRFLEGMQAQQVAPGFFDAITELFLTQPEQAQDLTALADLFARHADDVTRLMAMASGQTPDWVSGLSDLDGQMLMMSWWQVNAGFFTRRLIAAAAQQMGRQQAEASQ